MTPNPVAVIGGGPAGMSAALWLKRLGLQPVLYEAQPSMGGLQRLSNYPNDFLLGFAGQPANSVADAFARHLSYEAIRPVHARVERLAVRPGQVIVTVAGCELEFSAVVACVGTRWRRLTVPGAEEAERGRRLRFLGHGSDVHDAIGKRVVVIGGGDNATSAALEVGRFAKSVVVLSRTRLRGQHVLRQGACALPNVEVRTGQEVLSVAPGRLEVRSGGQDYWLDCDLVYVTIGFEPNTEGLRDWLKGLEVDAAGYLKVDADCRTSMPRLWAAGDVANPVHPCVATSVAMGTMAARNIEKTLFERPSTLEWSRRSA